MHLNTAKCSNMMSLGKISLFVFGTLWIEITTSPQIFKRYQQTENYMEHKTPPRQKYGFFSHPEDTTQTYGFFDHGKLQSNANGGKLFYRYNDFPYDKFEETFDQNLQDADRGPQTFTNDGDDQYEAEDRHSARNNGYDDHKTSQTTYVTAPKQVETITSEHYHKKSPAFDVSEFRHQKKEKSHGEVHYHQHKHIHKHEHKQEHVHQHKQDHEHKHVHEQQHKHEHHSGHKHQHKHDHHQEHKHDHRHGHKHDGGHKHQHHSVNKNNHGHRHKYAGHK